MKRWNVVILVMLLVAIYLVAYFGLNSGPIYFRSSETEARVFYGCQHGNVVFWPIHWLDRKVFRPGKWTRLPSPVPTPAAIRVSTTKEGG